MYNLSLIQRHTEHKIVIYQRCQCFLTPWLFLAVALKKLKKTHLILSHMPKFVTLNRSMVPHIGLYYIILSITGELGWLLASSTENETIGI